MTITIETLKKIDRAVASGEPLSLADICEECSLDPEILAFVAGELSRKVFCMDLFFGTIESYLVEMDKRVKRMSKQYKAIQSMQIMNGTIEVTSALPDPPIRW